MLSKALLVCVVSQLLSGRGAAEYAPRVDRNENCFFPTFSHCSLRIDNNNNLFRSSKIASVQVAALTNYISTLQRPTKLVLRMNKLRRVRETSKQAIDQSVSLLDVVVVAQ